MLDYLTDSYIRRKRFESKLLAVEIWTLFAEAMKENKSPASSWSALGRAGFGVK